MTVDEEGNLDPTTGRYWSCSDGNIPQSASTNEPGKRKRQQKRHYEEVLRTGPKNEKTQSE